MTVTAADIKALPSGEFSALSDTVVNKYLTRAAQRVDSPTWGDDYDAGIELLTAHMLVPMIAGGRAPVGPVTSETSGPISRSYASPANPTSLGSTAYGQQFVQMRAELGIMGFVP